MSYYPSCSGEVDISGFIQKHKVQEGQGRRQHALSLLDSTGEPLPLNPPPKPVVPAWGQEEVARQPNVPLVCLYRQDKTAT